MGRARANGNNGEKPESVAHFALTHSAQLQNAPNDPMEPTAIDRPIQSSSLPTATSWIRKPYPKADTTLIARQVHLIASFTSAFPSVPRGETFGAQPAYRPRSDSPPRAEAGSSGESTLPICETWNLLGTSYNDFIVTSKTLVQKETPAVSEARGFLTQGAACINGRTISGPQRVSA